jgi:membrane protease YdiL (CAAX protease family)
MSAPNGHHDDLDPLPRGQLLLSLLVVYGLLTVAGYGWLAWRERTAIIAASAVGRHGPVWAVAAGSLTAVTLSALSRLLTRYVRPVAALDARLVTMIGPLADRDAVLLSLVSGAAEEFFFRCAVQDAVGWLLATLLFALCHLGGRGLRLLGVQAALFGLVLGGLVESGLGLLAAALAHALFNYLWLQKVVLR